MRYVQYSEKSTKELGNETTKMLKRGRSLLELKNILFLKTLKISISFHIYCYIF